MLDKELADQLTDDEKLDIKYRYFELLPKVLAHSEILYEGSIEGTSEELIKTLAKVVISLRKVDAECVVKEVIAEDCCIDDSDCCSDCCEGPDEELRKPFILSKEQRLALYQVFSAIDDMSFNDMERLINLFIEQKS